MTKSIYSSKYERLRPLLVAARKSHALTQADVAERLGRPQSFVSKYERGERRLDVIEFLEVADALHLDPYSLLRQINQEMPHRHRERNH